MPVRKFSELPKPAHQCGIGSLLMTDADLPRLPARVPYQAAFWFDEDSRAVALVTDEEGHPMGWADPEAPLSDLNDEEFILLPEPIANEARIWLEAQRSP